MADLKLISEDACVECSGRGAGHNFQHCRACCGTGRLLVSLGSVMASEILNPTPTYDALECRAPTQEAARARLASYLAAIRANDEKYEVRERLVQIAVLVAKDAGFAAGYRIDPEEPEWPVAFIALPGIGQVSWHMQAFREPWDGHSTEEKFRRITRYCEEVLG